MELWEQVKILEDTNASMCGVYEMLKRENSDLQEQLAAQPSGAVTALLDLLEPDICRSEKLILHDGRLIKLIELYRTIRPKGDK